MRYGLLLVKLSKVGELKSKALEMQAQWLKKYIIEWHLNVDILKSRQLQLNTWSDVKIYNMIYKIWFEQAIEKW